MGVKSVARALMGVKWGDLESQNTSHKKHLHHDASHGIIGHEINKNNNSNMYSNPIFCAESVFDVGGGRFSTVTALWRHEHNTCKFGTLDNSRADLIYEHWRNIDDPTQQHSIVYVFDEVMMAW